MSQSPSKTEVRKARISKEEQIVQRIVELLNEKGYEYERDARPLICWKYNVNSSRDLTMEQKEEVKNALENGTFQKWGEEYKNQVLSNQIDVVKQIEQMASAPEALISTKIADQSDVKKQDKKSDSSVKKSTTSTAKKDVEEKIEAKSDILLSPKTKDKEASGKPQKLVESSNIKIEKLDKPSASVPKINLKMPAESVQKVQVESNAIEPPEKPLQNEQPLPAATANASVIEEEKTVQPQKTPVTPSKKDQLVVKTDGEEEKFQMGYEEAQRIVKARFSPNAYQDFSTTTVVVVLLSIILFLVSLTINFILISGKDLPGWLKFICNLFN